MGFFDFVKSAGEKLFGGGDKPDPLAIIDRINNLGLGVEKLVVEVHEETAIVNGIVQSQSDREKVVLCCGNVEGIAKVDDRLQIAEQEPQATFYTVVSGDTLSKIAKEHYGDAMQYPVIFEANTPMLTDPDLIYPGQVLRIPPQ